MGHKLLMNLFAEVAIEPVSWGSGKAVKSMERYKAVVNPKTGKVFAIVSQDYRLIRHEMAIERAEEALKKNGELGPYEVSTFFYNDGGRMRRKYRFPGISVYISKRDKVDLELDLFNSYDTTWPFVLALGAFRVICGNGLIVGRKYLHFRKRHIYQFEDIDINEEISSAAERFYGQSKVWMQWPNKILKPAQYNRVIKQMEFGTRVEEEIKNRMLDYAKGLSDTGFLKINFWDFYNVLTWYVTHRSVSLNHKIELERKLRKSIRVFEN